MRARGGNWRGRKSIYFFYLFISPFVEGLTSLSSAKAKEEKTAQVPDKPWTGRDGQTRIMRAVFQSRGRPRPFVTAATTTYVTHRRRTQGSSSLATARAPAQARWLTVLSEPGASTAHDGPGQERRRKLTDLRGAVKSTDKVRRYVIIRNMWGWPKVAKL